MGPVPRGIWGRAMGLRISYLQAWLILFSMHSSVFLNEGIVDEGTGPLSPSSARLHKVRPAVQHLQNICVPTSALSPRPHVHPTSARRVGRHNVSQGEGVTTEVDGDNDALQDWNERASVYFEWIGMVNLGAQRYSYFLTYLVGVID